MNTNQQIPLRGLAMILIAIAVALGFWVAISVIRDHSSTTNNAATTTSTVATSTSGAASTASQEDTAAENTEGAENPEGTENTEGAENAAPVVPVNILNNSLVSGLAAQVSDQVREAGFEIGNVGNYSESNFPSSVVLYPAGDAAAQAEAERIAQVLAIPAEVIPEGVNVQGVTVIATVDLNR